jgi:hypothetical protein
MMSLSINRSVRMRSAHPDLESGACANSGPSQGGQSGRSCSSPSQVPADYDAYAYAAEDERGYGWVVFAGVLLLMLGTLNFIGGLAAVGNAHFFTANAFHIVGSLNTSGWSCCASACSSGPSALAYSSRTKGFLDIGAPGFEPGTSPTRITRGPRSRYGKRPGNRQIYARRGTASHPRILRAIAVDWAYKSPV